MPLKQAVCVLVAFSAYTFSVSCIKKTNESQSSPDALTRETHYPVLDISPARGESSFQISKFDGSELTQFDTQLNLSEGPGLAILDTTKFFRVSDFSDVIIAIEDKMEPQEKTSKYTALLDLKKRHVRKRGNTNLAAIPNNTANALESWYTWALALSQRAEPAANIVEGVMAIARIPEDLRVAVSYEIVT
jgi:hypothetical protein